MPPGELPVWEKGMAIPFPHRSGQLWLAIGLIGASLLLAACAIEATTPSAAAPTAAPPAAVDPGSLTRQVERAEPIYRLWCKTCHGDVGQGLTVEFRMTWDVEHQNCWQSKCHIENHPPDGFVLPRTVPALVGPGALGKFGTAAELHGFIRATMPFQEPGILEDQDYWDLTAYILRINHFPLDDAGVGPENAPSIRLES
jgi:hypothetical protein